MTVLAFLQNQWFRDPARVKQIYERHPDMRNDLIARFLFAGCLTGRRLRSAFGDDLCDRITWEEVSPQIGNASSSVFPADPKHIVNAIQRHKPEVIVTLGNVALWAVADVWLTMQLTWGDAMPVIIHGPHPAARQNPMPRLREIAEELKRLTVS